MAHEVGTAPRRAAQSAPRRGRVAIAVVATGALLASIGSSITTAPTASAATKTTKKTAAKTAAKKTPTTKKRLPPKPAVGSKRAGALWQPNSTAWLEPLPFDPKPKSSDANNPSAPDAASAFAIVQPDAGVFRLLIIGTDARPGEKPEATRADSIHLFSYNFALKKGSLVGFPRDTFVTSAGGSQRKITEVMSTEGPAAFLATVNKLTGVGTKSYILTGFDGFKKMVDGVGGIKVKVDPTIDDPSSGAQFSTGWFQFNGNAALAYARARKTLPTGDFARSANQGKMLISGFGRLSESTDNIRALLNWVLVIRKNSVSNISNLHWMYLAQVARSINPADITSVVVPGKDAPDSSEIILDEAASKAIFADIADGVLNN